MVTMLAGVLMVMAPSVGAMVVSMCMLVLMFVVVSLSRSVHVFMAVEMLVRMGTFHGVILLSCGSFLMIPLFLKSWNTAARGLSDKSEKMGKCNAAVVFMEEIKNG